MHPYAWTWNEETLVLVPALAVGYGIWVATLGTERWRGACFAPAALLILAFGISPLHQGSLHYLLLIHLLQNVVPPAWAPLPLLHLEHLAYLATGCLLWWPVLRDVPRRLAAGARTLYVFGAFVLAAPIGLVLALVGRPAYSVYEHAPERVWGLSALADQQLGGVTMAAEQSVVFFAVFLYWFARFLAEQEHAPGDEPDLGL